jgi:choline-glycine betaine transporter
VTDRKIDWISFCTCVALILLILLVCVPLVAFTGRGSVALETLYRFLMDELGVVYLLASRACIGLLLWLALGRSAARCSTWWSATSRCTWNSRASWPPSSPGD